MRTLLIREYDIHAHGLDPSKFKDSQIYLEYGPSAGMTGPYGYHPNRMVYIIPETDPWFSVYSIKGIGHHHTFDDQVLRQNGWL